MEIQAIGEIAGQHLEWTREIPRAGSKTSANQPIEDIAEDVQHVPVPQESRRAEELARATARYLNLLEPASDLKSGDFRNVERYDRIAVERYSDNP